MSSSKLKEPDQLYSFSDVERSSDNDKKLNKWQFRLLPLMKGTIIGLIIFFFVASFFQLLYLQSRMEDSPSTDTNAIFSYFNRQDTASYQDKLNVTRLKADVLLEENIVARRYRQAGVLLMSGVWVRYMGFVTGMILAMVGAVFILGKLQISITETAAKIQGHELNIKTTSPGLILTILGAILMLATIILQQRHNVLDTAIYFNTTQVENRSLDTTGKPTLNPIQSDAESTDSAVKTKPIIQ